MTSEVTQSDEGEAEFEESHPEIHGGSKVCRHKRKTVSGLFQTSIDN